MVFCPEGCNTKSTRLLAHHTNPSKDIYKCPRCQHIHARYEGTIHENKRDVIYGEQFRDILFGSTTDADQERAESQADTQQSTQ